MKQAGQDSAEQICWSWSRNFSRRRLGAALAAAALAACARRRPEGEVNVYCWSDYVAPDTVASFERETRLRVNYETFESQEEMLAKILAGGAGWDVVFPGNTFIGPMVRRGLIEPIDHQRLPNLSNLNPRFTDPPWDRGIQHSVPYMWGLTGIVYNRRLIGRTLSRWSDLWDPPLKGKITMLDDPAEVLGACLKKLGYSLNSVNEKELQAAKAEAIRQKPLLRAFINAEVKPQLIAGDVWAAQLWNGDAYQAIAENKDLEYCLPEEGFALYTDSAAILTQSKHQDAAYQWINYLLRPDVAAGIARATMFPTPNARALGLLDAAVRQNPDLYPPPERLQKAEWFAEIAPEGQRLRDRIWTEIKAA
ncbi:MAG TPA: spermidine/putrescine ABC transporter substrate-binding protein [Bryobacterales bacterium]|jgi:spermidine/putrescine-binding protein|nr:spermidine/putrescine ABC transporter substrate-binding protein [Bryobacterales bacterium]